MPPFGNLDDATKTTGACSQASLRSGAPKVVRFEFWKGNVKQAGTFKIPNMTPEAALDYFMINWAQIGAKAATTPPISGAMRLRFGGV